MKIHQIKISRFKSKARLNQSCSRNNTYVQPRTLHLSLPFKMRAARMRPKENTGSPRRGLMAVSMFRLWVSHVCFLIPFGSEIPFLLPLKEMGIKKAKGEFELVLYWHAVDKRLLNGQYSFYYWQKWFCFWAPLMLLLIILMVLSIRKLFVE